MATTLLICNEDLQAVADPVDPWGSIEVTLRRNEVGSGQFVAPLTEKQFAQVRAPGNRVMCIRDGEVLISGPIERPGRWKWERDGSGQVTVNWADHLVCLGWRLTYPNPTLAHDEQDVIAWTSTGNAETSMRNLVNLNAGPGALTDRRVPGLTVAATAGVGTNVPVATRFEPLLDVLRRLATAGGSLNFQVTQVGAGIVFSVSAPRQRQARWTIGGGNVTSLETNPEAPTITVALVGGSGEGISRPVREVADSAAVDGWGRIERWVSAQDTDEDAQMDQVGADELAAGAETVGLSAVAVDGPGCRFRTDYDLGDWVGVDLNGQAVVALVTAVRVQNTPEAGEQITPIIGAEPSRDPATVRAVRAMDRRLGRLERS